MLSVAIVGCEQIHAQDYLDTSLADPRVRVVAVASERDPARARRLAAPHGLPVLDDFAQLPEVDLAFVTTAIEDHEAAVAALLPRARHLFVEKPLAVSAARAKALAAQLAGRSCFSGFYLRTDPALQQLRQLARAGAIGTLSHLSLTAGHLPIQLRVSATLRGPRLAIRLDGSTGTLELTAGRLLLHEASGESQVLAEAIAPGVPQGAQAVFDQLLGQPRPELANLEDALAANGLLDRLYGRD